MKPHSEHQQDDADFRELHGDFHVSRRSRRITAAKDARTQKADQGRTLQLFSNAAEDKRQDEGQCQSKKKRKGVIHWAVRQIEGSNNVRHARQKDCRHAAA